MRPMARVSPMHMHWNRCRRRYNDTRRAHIVPESLVLSFYSTVVGILVLSRIHLSLLLPGLSLIGRREYLHVTCGWMSTGPNRSTTEGINLLSFREIDRSRCYSLVNLLFTPVAGERCWIKRWMDRKGVGCIDGNEMDGKTRRVESWCGTVKICTPIGCWVGFDRVASIV